MCGPLYLNGTSCLDTIIIPNELFLQPQQQLYQLQALLVFLLLLCYSDVGTTAFLVPKVINVFSQNNVICHDIENIIASLNPSLLSFCTTFMARKGCMLPPKKIIDYPLSPEVCKRKWKQEAMGKTNFYDILFYGRGHKTCPT